MAALEKIRSKAGCLIGIIAFALLCFIIGDFLTSGTTLFGMSQNKVGEVNGNSLSFEEFTEQANQMTEMMKGRSQASDAEIRNGVWQDFLMSSLVEDECDNAHLSVSPAELSDNIVGSHPNYRMLSQIPLLYGQDGQFNPRMANQIIEFINRDASTVPAEQQEQFVEQQNEIRNMWLYWEKKIKQNLYQQKLMSVLNAAMSAPKAEVDLLASMSANEYDALIARKQISSVPDNEVKVDSSDAKNLYNKVKEVRYKTEGTRDLFCAYYPIVPSVKDINAVKTEMDTLRSQLQAAKTEAAEKSVFASSDHHFPYSSIYRTGKEIGPDYSAFAFSAAAGSVSEPVIDGGFYKMAKLLAPVVSRPDSVKISMIPVAGKDSNAVKVTADSIVKAIKAGAKFEDMVAKYNKQDKNNGDLGWIREGAINMDKFDDKAFNANVGDVFTVSNAQAAFVIKVTDKTSAVKKAKIAVLALPVEPSKATLDSVYNMANELSTSAASLDKFKEICKKQNVEAHEIPGLEQNMPGTQVLPNSRCLVKWAWEESTKVGDVSSVFSDIPNSYVVVTLTKMVDKGYVPYDFVKNDLMTEVTNDKKAEKLMTDMSKFKSLEEAGQVDTVKAVRFSSDGVSTVGREPALVGAITASKANVLSKPVKGQNAVYMFKVTESRKSSMPAMDANTAKEEVMRSIYGGLFEALKDKADVEDNRYRFY